MKRFLSIPLALALIALPSIEAAAQSVSSSSSRSSLSSSRSSVSSSRMSSSRSSLAENRLDFTVDLDRYSDAPWDLRTNVAVSALTEFGILLGNDDGTFRPERGLNRAEFMTIVMRILPDSADVNLRCFPDVSENAWYARSVCRAKAAGIVRGNAIPGVPQSQWRFEPARGVQYEEAVKVLVKMYAIPIVGDEEGMDWYVPFIQAAERENLDISGLRPGEEITRGEMARLTVAFAARASGQLEDLRDIEEGRTPSSSSSRRSSMSSSSSRSSVSSGMFDPIDDVGIRSDFLVLGETSPVLAGIEFFSNDEPITATDLTIRFTGDVDSISSVLIYDEDGRLIDTAFEGSTQGVFTASLPGNVLALGHREPHSIYLRANTRTRANGGVSGEDVQVQSVTLEGTGDWSGTTYSRTSTDTFNVLQTSFGAITSIESIGTEDDVLYSSSNRLLGEFRIEGDSDDSLYDTRITALTFRIAQSGNVSLSNVYLRDRDSGSQISCSNSSTLITCSSIPQSIGEVDGSTVLQVYGDVSAPSGDGVLQISLSDPGNPSDAGDITWTDGVTTFTWLPFSTPVAQGTRFD